MQVSLGIILSFWLIQTQLMSCRSISCHISEPLLAQTTLGYVSTDWKCLMLRGKNSIHALLLVLCQAEWLGRTCIKRGTAAVEYAHGMILGGLRKQLICTCRSKGVSVYPNTNTVHPKNGSHIVVIFCGLDLVGLIRWGQHKLPHPILS